MLISDYFSAIRSRIAEIEAEESDNIARVADFCAESVRNGGVIHVHDTGHMLNSELMNRAGGLVGLTPFTYSLAINNPNSFRDRQRAQATLTAETIALALKRSNIRKGDVLFVGSVSGKSEPVVELAIQARAMGVIVVGTTSLEYSSRLESQHPSGKRLYEVADLVLNNHAPYGDAMLEADGLDAKVCPASGVCAACIMWAVVAGIVERLLAAGLTPSVFKSANAPGGIEDGNKRRETYKETGI